MGIFKRFKKSNTTTSPSDNGHNTLEDDIQNKDGESTSAVQAKAAPDGASAAQRAHDRGNLWQRLQSGLKKTRDVLKTDIRDLLKTEGQLVDDEFLKRLFAILVKTDMGGGPAEKIKSHIESQFQGRVIEFEDVLTIIRSELTELLTQPNQPVRFAQSGPSIILVCLLYTSPSPRDQRGSRMPSSA